MKRNFLTNLGAEFTKVQIKTASNSFKFNFDNVFINFYFGIKVFNF